MQKNKKRIYLDYAATTPVDPEVVKAMQPYFSRKFGNAMSFHSYGQEAMAAVDKARFSVAEFLNCEESEVIFTSGATESNNTVLKGVVDWYWQSYKRIPHLITTKIEHDCILETAKYLKKMNRAQVSFVGVNSDGLIKLNELKKAIKSNTVLASVMYVNNEIGIIQPIVEIGNFLKQVNRKRKNKIFFHSDAAQAVNYLNCQVKYLGVDFLSLSAHKAYGPKGVGALYASKKAPKIVFMHGGEQESGKRSSTHNVPAIVGFGKAIELISKYDPKKVEALRNYMIDQILTKIPKVYLNGSRCIRVPNNVNFTFRNIEGESILLALDLKGVAASTGSACSSGSLEPSHVIMAIGGKAEQAHGSVRFSLGRQTTKKEIDLTISLLIKITDKLRKISPYKR